MIIHVDLAGPQRRWATAILADSGTALAQQGFHPRM